MGFNQFSPAQAFFPVSPPWGLTMLSNSSKVLRTIIAIVVLFFIAETLFILSNGRPDTHLNDLNHSTPAAPNDALDWSRFAYAQYVTNIPYLCNSVMFFETLNRLQSKADRIMMYPTTFLLDENNNGTESRLLRKVRDEYKVKLIPIEIQSRSSADGKRYPFSKHVFNVRNYRN